MALDAPTHLIIATVAPVSLDCKQTICSRHNRAHLMPRQPPALQPDLRDHPTLAVKLDFNTLLGQLCFSFGASRASDIWLSGAEGVDKRHFVLFLDCNDGQLYIRDTSFSGTTISYEDGGRKEGRREDTGVSVVLNRGQMSPVAASMLVSCGKGICFRVRLAEDARRQSDAFVRCLMLYARSVALWTCLPAGKRRRTEANDTTERPSRRRALGTSSATDPAPPDCPVVTLVQVPFAPNVSGDRANTEPDLVTRLHCSVSISNGAMTLFSSS